MAKSQFVLNSNVYFSKNDKSASHFSPLKKKKKKKSSQSYGHNLGLKNSPNPNFAFSLLFSTILTQYYGHTPGWNLIKFMKRYKVWSLLNTRRKPMYLADFWVSNHLSLLIVTDFCPVIWLEKWLADFWHFLKKYSLEF